ncbi:hypothetical protein PL81_17330 [Streptomyces sp. RSD-27]|nr:hypothetical protein PL81_17330 [Streptomyces sp. RSD-27]
MPSRVTPSHSTRTAARQRDFVRERLGAVYDPERARKVAAAALYEAVPTQDNPADLINVALEKLVKARRWTRSRRPGCWDYCGYLLGRGAGLTS